MPVSGGAADKLGNRYETLWAIDQLLRIVDGDARWLTLEPLDPDEARGVEFTVANVDGTTEYWSVKRQTTKATGWTLRLLAAKDEGGRAILRDLLGHVESNLTHYAVFASTLGAPAFEELRSFATSKETLEARLDRSADLNLGFRNHILPLCGGDTERALAFLRRTRTHAADEARLREVVSFKIRKLLYAEDGSPLNVAAMRGYLGDLLLNNIHRPIDRDTILDVLVKHGVRLREWATDKSVQHRIDAMCEAYTAPLRSQWINGKFLPLLGSDSILSADSHPIARRMLVVGGAGGGKSTILADIVGRLRGSHLVVLPIRFDHLPGEILSTTELGRKLLLPESPAITLAGVASGGPCVLVIDQLDSISLASGRRTELWSLFEELRREAERFPGMSLIIGCREFDLEHDHRMREMKSEASGFAIVPIKPLPMEQVDDILRDVGVTLHAVPSTLKPVLCLPLHLSMFLSLPTADRTGVHSRDELFDRFWTEGERRTGRRIGRRAYWTQVIDSLANWLSVNQQLSAPQYVLDHLSADAAAMASEHILVLAESRYRFFHESFFDYAFARGFAARGERLLDLLHSDEQHLFRRGQVRQVLSYLRTKDRPRYLRELGSVLSSPRVRFHIKRFVFQWMSSLTDPRREEWGVLQALASADAGVRSHVLGVIWGNSAWFDVLDSALFFDAALSSGDAVREQEAVRMLSSHTILETRSDRVAALMRQYRQRGETWDQYIRHVCRTGKVYHSLQMFDLFLSLIDDGTLDGLRPGFAVNDDWWTVLYSMAKERPDLACKATGRWLDHVIATWRGREEEQSSHVELWRHLDQSGHGTHLIYQIAASSPLCYVEQILPRVAKFLDDTTEEVLGYLSIDPLWSFRSFGDNQLLVHGAILSALSKAMENLAKAVPAELDRVLAPYQERTYNAIAYLVLSAWTAAPEVYADRLADYLVADARRLKVGYSSWSSRGGSPANHVSVQAVKQASVRCTLEQFVELERAILSLTDDWESKHPQQRGLRQLELLTSLDRTRLSAKGRARLRELQRKFPSKKFDPPSETRAVYGVEPPISEKAQGKMSDEHWLHAMQRYSGVNLSFDKGRFLFGGERELAQSLEARARINPQRFAALAERMSDDFLPSYFEHIVFGIANSGDEQNDSASTLTLDNVVSLIRRVHALPGRPCGAAIASLIEKSGDRNWPAEVLDILVWYSMNDPDPEEELWRKPASGDQPYYGGDPYTAGINSTRGRVAGAIARLLFNKAERFAQLHNGICSLAHDRSIAVRACAIEPLLAVVDIAPEKAISWFVACVAADPVILETPWVERFVQFAGYRDYVAIRPAINEMLSSTSDRAIAAGARQVCLLALDVEEAEVDAELIRSGTATMRRAAADVYSTNIAHEGVGQICRRLLTPLFSDSDESVRVEAASAFKEVASLATLEQADLLSAFLDASPGKTALEPVVRALEDSPLQLPKLVCRLVEMCINAYRAEAGDISRASAMVAMDLSKIVVRLYAQTDDSAIQGRCLDLIDEMERYHFMGLSEELQRLDR